MRPTLRLLCLCWGIVGLATLVSLRGEFMPPFLVAVGLLVTVAFIDAIFGLRTPRLVYDRALPGRFALGQEERVKLTFANRGKRTLQLKVFDGVPEGSEALELPWKGSLAAGRRTEVSYAVRLLERGPKEFSSTHVLVASPLGLWRKLIKFGNRTSIKVYPNYEPLISYALLATEQRIEQMGIIRKNKAGLSKEFHQLRDYAEGDSLSQIDWKSSARRLELISRDYQEQRDQTILLAIDAGSRMRSVEGELSHFDHCLNSILLLSYIALRQGDKVGVIKFGGRDRWLPPVKGPHQMPTLLNHLYDYDVSPDPSDFREAAEKILINQKRRAMVVILTNLRGEDSTELFASLEQLRRTHLVVLASLQESSVMEMAGNAQPGNLNEALSVAGAHKYQQERKEVLDRLRDLGIFTIDTTARDLPIALCNTYLDVKSRL